MEADRMDRHYRSYRWATVLLGVAVAAIAGFFAYNAGVSHGIAVASQPIAGGGAVVPPYPYGWYRPWGFGLFGPFLFIFFWIFLLRGLFWAGRWRRYGGCYGGGYYDGPRAFDEWHRRAHERMTSAPAGSAHDDDRSRS